jgi:phosphatidylethanolamine/phosphatidyl-N-methylethanolamine N-methyltransferase
MFKDLRLFVSEIRDNFSAIGAIAPSSPRLAKAIVRPLRQRPPTPVTVLEVGPGTGSFTHRILELLRPGDALEIYELNPKFCLFLRESLNKAQLSERGIRCELYNADIRSLRRTYQFDYIISGLPFNSFDVQTVSEILETLMNHLGPAGVLSYFEYSLPRGVRASLLKSADRIRMARVGRAVELFNRKHQYSCSHVWWNLPPARARHCRKSP